MATSQTSSTGIVATPNANATSQQLLTGQSYLASQGFTPSGGGSYSNASMSMPSSTSAPAVSTTTNASSISNGSTALTVPTTTNPATTLNGSNGLVATVNSTQPQTNTDDTSSNDSSSSDSNSIQQKTLDAILGTSQELGNEGATFNAANEAAGVPEMTTELANLRGTIAQRTAGYLAQYNQANVNGGVQSFVTGEQTEIQRTSAVELGMLGAQEQALSGNLQAAEDLVNQSITHQFSGLQNQLSGLQQFYTDNQNNLTASESATLTENYAIQNMNLQNAQTVGNTVTQALSSQGLLTPATVAALAGAKSPGDFWNIYNNVLQGNPPGAGTSGSVATGTLNGVDVSTYDPGNPNYVQSLNATCSDRRGIKCAAGG